MAKKKVMLFIVEGPTDETSLSTVLNRIFSSSTVKFQVVHGDILTRDFTSSDKIVAAVWEQVKEFMGSIYRKSDICRIVHLTDMDGVFIPDDAVVENDTVEILIRRQLFGIASPKQFIKIDPDRDEKWSLRQRSNDKLQCWLI